MDPSRAALSLLLLAIVGCSSPEPPAATTAPTIPPSSSPAGLVKVSATSSPTLADKSCTDFTSPAQAQDFYIESGGPDEDLHGLDPDRNGNACDEQPVGGASPAPVTVAGATVTPAPAPQPAATSGPPQSYNSSSGAVDGTSGGEDRHSSCESSDETRCD
jgi:hypothetical protein